VIVLQPRTPIVVEVIEQPTRETTVYDVLIGSIGLLGVIVLAAVVVGLVAGGVLIGIKKWRDRHDGDAEPGAVRLGIDPATRRD
jgi:hypothetical protein